VAQAVEWLPSKCEALYLNTSTAKKQNNNNKKKKEGMHPRSQKKEMFSCVPFLMFP
jgi:hypothetical protein